LLKLMEIIIRKELDLPDATIIAGPYNKWPRWNLWRDYFDARPTRCILTTLCLIWIIPLAILFVFAPAFVLSVKYPICIIKGIAVMIAYIVFMISDMIKSGY